MTKSDLNQALDRLSRYDLLDLHTDALIPARLLGLNPLARHGRAPFFGRLFGHLDVPRLTDGRLAGAMWAITTNPFRRPAPRLRALYRNLARLKTLVADSQGALGLARTAAEYAAVRAQGAHAVLPAIQGANALRALGDAPLPAPLAQDLTRVTLVHLTPSVYGATSSPFGWASPKGLTEAGRALLGRLCEARVLIDLAHLHPVAFWEVLAALPADVPVMVSHTGVSALRPSWRNLDDAQLRAVADRGGVVGVLYHGPFITWRGGPKDERAVAAHLHHIFKVAGEATPALGSDLDGFILPVSGLRSADTYPRLIQALLALGLDGPPLAGLMGQNFLRLFKAWRP